MWRLRMFYTGFEYIRMSKSKVNSREGIVNHMNGNKCVCINHCNNLNCSVSSRNRNQLKVSKWSHISKSHNFEKSSFQKSNLCMTNSSLRNFEETESVQSSSQSELYNAIPLILYSKDEIRKLAESVRMEKSENWKENYRQLPVRNSEFHHSSVVNCSAKETAVDINERNSFNVKEKGFLNRGVNAKMPIKEFLQILHSSNNLSSDILLNINGRFTEQQIGQEITKERDISSIHQKNCLSSNNSTESSSPTDSLEARQPSPVSVLDLKRVIPDPKELQKQLGLLKHELDSSSYELPQILYTEKENNLQLIQEINLEFSDEEERDFSYLLDMLIDSGFHSASDQKKLLKLCYETDSPIRPQIFSNLEKKYKKISNWSRSERKLLFDMVNSILGEILSPLTDLRPWVRNEIKIGAMWGAEGLVEKIWQKLVRMRENLMRGDPETKVFDGKWVELEGNMDLVGREIERRIKDELVDELVLELLMEL